MLVRLNKKDKRGRQIYGLTSKGRNGKTVISNEVTLNSSRGKSSHSKIPNDVFGRFIKPMGTQHMESIKSRFYLTNF